MHIAFVINSLGGGGAEQVVYRLVDGLSERGHKVDVVVLQTVIYHHLPQGVRVFLLGGRRIGLRKNGPRTCLRGPSSFVRLLEPSNGRIEPSNGRRRQTPCTGILVFHRACAWSAKRVRWPRTWGSKVRTVCCRISPAPYGQRSWDSAWWARTCLSYQWFTATSII